MQLPMVEMFHWPVLDAVVIAIGVVSFVCGELTHRLGLRLMREATELIQNDIDASQKSEVGIPISEQNQSLIADLGQTEGHSHKPAAPAATAPASPPSAAPATKGKSMFASLSGLTSLFSLAKAGIELSHDYASVAPQLASGAGKLVQDGKGVAGGIGELISDIKGGRWQETPEDITAILGKFGDLVGDTEDMVTPAAKIVSKASGFPSVAGLKNVAHA